MVLFKPKMVRNGNFQRKIGKKNGPTWAFWRQRMAKNSQKIWAFFRAERAKNGTFQCKKDAKNGQNCFFFENAIF